MKVVMLRADWGACSLYRVEQPARCVNESSAGVEVVVTDGLDVDAYRLDDGSTRVREVRVDADVVVLQRPVDHVWCQVIPLLQARGVAVIVEIDDDFESISLRNSAWRRAQPEHSPWSNRTWLKRACELADGVTVSSDRLLEVYAAHGRGTVLRNYVSYAFTETPRTVSYPRVRVGWTGTLQTHPDDLQVTGRGVARAMKGTTAELRIVGDATGVRSALGLPASTFVGDTGWVPLPTYGRRIADSIDVGIVPLLDTRFNQAKSWLKLLEFSALGIPTVASPTPENRLAGLGSLADSPSRWRSDVRALINDRSLREHLGGVARETVRSYLLAETHLYDWVEAWESARDRRAVA